MSRILLASLGSLGDLHPALALGLELARRGHRVTLSTHEAYRAKVEGEGLGFVPMPPDIVEGAAQAELMARVMHETRGSETVIRDLVLPVLAESYRILAAAARDTDLLVSHPITFHVPIVAERLGLPWVSTTLQPLTLLSAYDPPITPPILWIERLRGLGPGFHAALFALGRQVARGWAGPIERLRREVGLPPSPVNPILEGMVSPRLHLALFSPAFAAPQPDWPPQTVTTGYLFYDRREPGHGLPPDLASFLDRGEPPVVFTLGSSAVHTAGAFYEESARAAGRLGRRAVLLAGPAAAHLSRGALPRGVTAFDYAPYSELLPRARLVVHQAGAGTTAQALRAGQPMLAVPFSHDQPDHAARLERLGVALRLPRRAYVARRVEERLARLLEELAFAERAAELGRKVRAERGAERAAEAIEAVLRG
jgi:UDP:flavonoid glycosyltransferase YjiC (YdhE family)